jgi:hypothetical protein
MVISFMSQERKVGVAQARDIEFEAKYVGDWMLHCHLPHHMMNQMVSMVGPMSHLGHGTHTGLGMEEGMGMIKKGNALSEELGPGFGRGMAMASRERETSNMVGQQSASQTTGSQQTQGDYVCPMHPEVRSDKPGTCPKCGMALTQAKDDQKRVPGYPQDMWMTMDEAVAKPETYGLAPGWTGATMGMMTYIRVLPPDMYDKVMTMIRERRVEQPKKQPEHKHDGGR